MASPGLGEHMKRRDKAGGKAAKTQRRKTLKRRNAPKTARRHSAVPAGKETNTARLARERDEALDQLAATSEVLKVISSLPGELEPVFQAILANATRICEAKFGILFEYTDGKFCALATLDVPPAFADFHREPRVWGPDTGLGQLARVKKTVHIHNTLEGRAYAEQDPGRIAAVEIGGVRSFVAVPMLKDGEFIGAIIIFRQEVRPFTDKQIELVTNFASQAVIAIENARLLSELRELLQQQTATADVLKVISSSPGELGPVFQAMLENATRLCEASYSAMWLCEGDGFRSAALYGALPAAWQQQWRTKASIRVHPDAPAFRAIKTRKPVHVVDLSQTAAYREGDPLVVSGVDVAGIRTMLTLPMFKDDEAIGAISIFRMEVRPFSDKQIELVSNFAAQAVIAIENTRLLNELRESLQQQTATADVLKVISRSTFDLRTVLGTLIESAVRLCEAERGSIWRPRGASFHLAASYGHTDAWKTSVQEVGLIPGRESITGRVLLEGKIVHIHDVQADPEYAISGTLKIAGNRTMLGVPLLREGTPIGVIVVSRSIKQPFTDKQIALVSTFADQAAIAIENVRLFEAEQQRTTELSEALQQQTATADVLKVISSSPGELEPVFNAMLANAVRICEAKLGTLFLSEGDGFRTAALYGAPPAFAEARWRNPVLKAEPGTGLGRVAATKRAVQIADIRQEPAYTSNPSRSAILDLAGARTMLNVPMLKENELVGQIGIFRQEVRPFSDKQIALVENFAAQAVIAIENTRLLSELRQRTTDLTESLEQQTATSEVLRVISSSPTNVQPVLDSIVRTAVRLCNSYDAVILLRESEHLRIAAHHGPMALDFEWLPLGRDFVSGRTVIDGVPVHVPDFMAAGAEFPRGREVAKRLKQRTVLGLPLRREGQTIGCLFLRRTEVLPFTDKQIGLLTTFADQAVIAIENVRLFETEQQRTRELSEALEQQTATSEVLKIISSSPGELEPVFSAMLANATRICEATLGTLYLSEGPVFRAVAAHSKEIYADFLRRNPVVDLREHPGIPLDRLANTKQVVHIPDMQTDESYIRKNARMITFVEGVGARTCLAVPMLKEDELVGAILIYRQEVRPFTDKQIELVKNFAAQAVIAIENTRLLSELRESLQQQTATADVLKVISRSTFDLQVVLRHAGRICSAPMRCGDGKHLASYGTVPIASRQAMGSLLDTRNP